MKIIVGLGNIGKNYEQTRHNVGFMMLDFLEEKWDLTFKEEKKWKGSVAYGEIEGEKVLFLKPSTYMNSSGEAVVAVKEYYKVEVQDILVVYDDMDLDLGDFRYKKKGSSGGQKGMANIMELLGTKAVPRLKIGIGKRPEYFEGKDYVLSTFKKEELKLIGATLEENVEGLTMFVSSGIEDVMNNFNGKKNA